MSRLLTYTYDGENACRIVSEYLKGRAEFEDLQGRYENNIEVELKEIILEGVN